MDMDETTEQCARRELKEETGLEVGEVKQVGAYFAVNRDPRGRTITVAYVTYISQALPVAGLDDAAQAKWWPVNTLPPLAFDHTQILQDAFLILKQ
jgi:8-oxo-dGTP diphosphatase